MQIIKIFPDLEKYNVLIYSYRKKLLTEYLVFIDYPVFHNQLYVLVRIR